MIEVLTGSPLNSIQDLGRHSSMALGVARGGAMDPEALQKGNILVGNPRGMAGVEVVFYPFKIRFHQNLRFAVTGARGKVLLEGMPLPPDTTAYAKAGQVLVVNAPTEGVRTYLTFSGGLDVPEVLDSRSTDMKAEFGGMEGRSLQAGDRLLCLPETSRISSFCEYSFKSTCHLPDTSITTVRCLSAAEYDCFTDESKSLFSNQAWSVTPTANRVGYRLESETVLSLSESLELLSHGIVPGTVQVPPVGQPIVQMSDANTCGGYPKIATVIEPDLRLIAQTRVGHALRFVMISRDEAVEVIRQEEEKMGYIEREIKSTLRSVVSL